MPNSLMLDIETLSTQPEAAVISIGYVAFNQEDGIVDSGGHAIKSQDWHGHIDPNTVRWWMQQSEAAKQYSFSGTTGALDAAAAFAQFFAKHKPVEIWARDPEFDCVVVRQWWERVQKKMFIGNCPLNYKLSRSCRTMDAEAERVGLNVNLITPFHHYVAHNPIDDASSQARVVIAVRKHLRAA